MWLRLARPLALGPAPGTQPCGSPTVRRPLLSVSCVLIPTKHEFISTTRRQLRTDKAKVRVRSAGLDRNEWLVRDGFAVTSPVRTLVDLEAVGTDGGHLGNYVSDALRSGTIQRVEVDALNLSQSTDALLAMADKTGP